MSTLYKKQVRPIMESAAWMGVQPERTPLSDWIDIDDWNQELFNIYDKIRESKDKLSFLKIEERYINIEDYFNYCNYCDIDSSDCCIFQDPLDGVWYMEVGTEQWSEVDDDFVYKREYGVKYCPYCGRKLVNMHKKEGLKINEQI